MDGSGMGLGATTERDVQPSSPEAWQSKSKEEAEAHWSYVQAMLMTHGLSDELISVCGWHYRTAMIHGFKHGVEWVNDK